MALDWLTDYHRSRALAEQARPLVEPLHSALLDARLKEALGRTACRFNDEVTGIELLRAAAALAEPLGDPGYEVVVVSNLLLGFVLALRPSVWRALVGQLNLRNPWPPRESACRPKRSSG